MSAADRPIRVTWLGHGAERTGPPIYLLRILEGLRAHPEIEPSVVLLEGGPLLDELAALAPTTVVAPAELHGARRAAASVLSRANLGRAAEQVARPGVADVDPADIAIVNTAGSVRALPVLPRPRVLVTHVHELATGLDYWMDPTWRQVVLDESDELWVVADAVGRHLVERYGADPARMRTHRGVLPAGALDLAPAEELAAHRRSLGVGPDDVLVGASGTLDWRKAPDLFVEVAVRAIAAARSTVHLAWIGGDASTPWADLLARSAAAAGIADRIHLLPELDRPDRLFGALDLFLLPSREDAYPLVCLEAAAAGVPIATFDSGGAPELLVDGGGVVVPYPDAAALAAAVVELADDPALRASHGRAARAAAAAHTIEAAVPRLVADLQRLAGR